MFYFFPTKIRSTLALPTLLFLTLLSSCRLSISEDPLSVSRPTTLTENTHEHIVVEGRYQYSAHSYWNDYGKKSDPTIECNPAVDNACVHVGQLRKVTTTETDCTDLTLSDQLSLFDWTCAKEGPNAVFTGALKYGKSLRDLLNPGAWKPNKVSLYKNSILINESDPAQNLGWNNTVSTLPDASSEVVTLATTGAIYTTADTTSTFPIFGYNLNADKIAVVTLGSSKLTQGVAVPANCSNTTGETAAPTSVCILAIGSQNHLWIEADLYGTTPGVSLYGLMIYRMNHSKVVNTHSGLFGNGIMIKESSYNRWDNISVVGGSLYGFYLIGPNSTGNVISRLKVLGNNMGTAINIFNTSGTVLAEAFSIFQIKAAGGSSPAIQFINATNPIVVRALAANSRSGLYAGANGAPSTGGIFHQIAALNNGVPPSAGIGTVYAGIYLPSGSNNNGFSQIALLHNDFGIRNAADAGSSNPFMGNLLVGSSTVKNCETTNAISSGLTDTTCAPTGPLSTANVVSGLDLLGENPGVNPGGIVGPIPSRDNTNLSDDGTGGVPAGGTVLDYLRFDNFLRFWGSSTAVFPATTSRTMGDLAAEGLRIWDWSLKIPADANKNPILNSANSGIPNPATQDFSSINGGDCPSFIGDTITSNGVTYLKNAVEILDTDGNNNALCEAGETCLYTPNFGAYQGHGPLGECSMLNHPTVALRGTKIKGHLTNGY